MTAMIKPRHGTNLESRVEEQEQSMTIFDPIFAWISRRPFLRQVRFAPFFPHLRTEKKKKKKKRFLRKGANFTIAEEVKKKNCKLQEKICSDIDNDTTPFPWTFFSPPPSI